MAFFAIILILINYFSSLLGSESNNNAMLEIKPFSASGGQNIGFYKVEDTLNLTCIFKNETFQPNVILEWTVPTKASNSQNRVISKQVANSRVLTMENLQENDSGDYKCTAVHNGIPFFKMENTLRINVKNKKKECADSMFQCAAGNCIPKRYTCDGHNDCRNGEDESSSYCGPGNPCDNKLRCPENRCIPYTWCCELHREPNCTTKVKHRCCTHVDKLTRDVESDLSYQYEQQRFNDMGFLQTTVYTVIGCAMAFMFIVTIIVIAICRVHVRRTLLSRCPTSNRNIPLGRGGNVNGNQLNGLSFYDLDVYFNRSGLNANDLMSVNPLLVTYNINNGVQFVGRPVDPPPYCEIVTSPPKEGPPPPYVSHEDLTRVRRAEETEEPKANDGDEVLEVEAEVSESDALLGAAGQSNVSIVSSNAVDVVVVPVPEEISAAVTSTDEPEQPVRGGLLPKELLETAVNSESSHCETSPSAGKEVVKNSGVDIVVLTGRDAVLPENLESLKVQNGESSSYVSGGGVADRSMGAVRKIVRVNSTGEGGTCRKKSKKPSQKVTSKSFSRF